MKKLRVTVDGQTYDVLVEILDEGAASTPGRSAGHPAHVESAHVSAPPVSAGTHHDGPAASGDVPSPLAGKVVSIDVKPGQHVQANAQLLTLEAMKMNTYIFAPAAGTVKEILVAPGDAVEEGRVLVRMS
ncbi:MAG: biotin/lipoyl-containing protein [Chthoniobacterales bacterium]